MPRAPAVAAAATAMPAGVFSRLADRIRARRGEVYPLHVGDTWRPPPPGAELQALPPGNTGHLYGPPEGLPPLREALRRHRGVDPDRLLITAGATGALSAAAGTLLDPGDEVLILTPCWPLIPGIVQASSAVPRMIPFYDRLDPARPSAPQVEALLGPAVGPRTAALYVNSPNNPTGVVLPPAWLEALAAFARRHGLWVWSDEVYDACVYDGEHAPFAAHAPERTFTAWSFSKAWGLAGYRVGTLEAPTIELCGEVRKLSMHLSYGAPTGPQLAAARALEGGGAWQAESRAAYAAAGRAAAARLGLTAPPAGTFLFVDVRAALEPGLPEAEALHRFLVRCVDRGLLLAPGSSCGPDHGGAVRLCFTSAPPEVVARGVEVLAGLLAEGPRAPEG